MAKKLIAGRYEVVRELGRGGMGVVLLAFDHRLQTEVALKFLQSNVTADSGEKDSLIKEARILARLTHPSIVRVFDLADTEEGLILVLEYVCGPNLWQIMKARWKFTETELIHVMKQVCDGLETAHSEKIIHRDLKPPNLLVSLSGEAREAFRNGVVSDDVLAAKIKITDFGISKLLDLRRERTRTSAPTADADPRPAFGYLSQTTAAFAGTPAYMSPEQYLGQPCTPATDIYALGVIAYQAISGSLPFPQGDQAYQHVRVKPQPIDGCSPHINAAILRAMEKDPAARFRSATEFLDALSDKAAGSWIPSGAGQHAPPEQEAGGLGSQWKAIAALGAAMAAVLIGGLAYRGYSVPTNITPDSRGPAQVETIRANPVKLIVLPSEEDMEPPPKISQLPPSEPFANTEPANLSRGPRKPHLAWRAWIDSNRSGAPFVDAVSPDGTVYIRDQGHMSEGGGLWAIRDAKFQWGYAANRWKYDPRAGWDREAGIRFQSDGIFRIDGCGDRPKDVCFGYAFNFNGKGGWLDRRLPALPPPGPTPGVTPSFAFHNEDERLQQWPREKPKFRCSGKARDVTLEAVGQDGRALWQAKVDGACEMGSLDPATGDLYIATKRNTIYAIASAGAIRWSYESLLKPWSLHSLPGGKVVVTADRLTCLRDGAVEWTHALPASIQNAERLDPYWGEISQRIVNDPEGMMYFSTWGGGHLIHAVDPSGKQAWILNPGPDVGQSLSGLMLDRRGNLYVSLSSSGLDARGKSSAGVLCIMEKR